MHNISANKNLLPMAIQANLRQLHMKYTFVYNCLYNCPAIPMVWYLIHLGPGLCPPLNPVHYSKLSRFPGKFVIPPRKGKLKVFGCTSWNNIE